MSCVQKKNYYFTLFINTNLFLILRIRNIKYKKKDFPPKILGDPGIRILRFYCTYTIAAMGAPEAATAMAQTVISAYYTIMHLECEILFFSSNHFQCGVLDSPSEKNYKTVYELLEDLKKSTFPVFQ